MIDDLVIIDKDGNRVSADVLAIFSDGGNRYVAYMANGESDTLVSRFNWTEDKNTIVLRAIESEDEWKRVEKFLEEEVFGDDFW